MNAAKFFLLELPNLTINHTISC